MTALYLESQTGDWVGAGQTHSYGVNGATYSVLADPTQVTVNVVAWDNSFDDEVAALDVLFAAETASDSGQTQRLGCR